MNNLVELFSRRALTCVFAALVFVIGADAGAQEAASDGDAVPIAVPHRDGNVRLQPGDELILLIPEMGDSGESRVTVDADGEISLGIYGRVQVAGQTEDEALSTLRAQLRPYLRSTAGVLVTLERRQQLVLVTGRVLNPGMQAIGARADVWMAIQSAGGAADGADLARVTLVRDGVESRVDVRGWLVGRDHEALPTLAPGDTVFVPANSGFGTDEASVGAFLDDELLAERVFVIGAVTRPGIYDRFEGIDVLTAVALAGGPTVDANLALVRVITAENARNVDLTGHMLGEPVDISLPFQTSAIVYLPAVRAGESTDLSDGITVIGSFSAPGNIEVRQPITMMELLGRAGGPNAEADLRRLHHVRRDNGVTIAARYDLRSFVRHGSALGDVLVAPGDVVYLGSNIDNGWERFVGAVSDVVVVASAAVLIVTLRDALNTSN